MKAVRDSKNGPITFDKADLPERTSLSINCAFSFVFPFRYLCAQRSYFLEFFLSNADYHFSMFTTKSMDRNLTPWTSKTIDNLCLFYKDIISKVKKKYMGIFVDYNLSLY